MTNGGKLALKIGLRILLAALGVEAGHLFADSFDGAADAAGAGADINTTNSTDGEPTFGSGGMDGRFPTDYVGPTGNSLVSDAAGNMYDPNTGTHYSPYDTGVTRA